jgi:hypothetical protein
MKKKTFAEKYLSPYGELMYLPPFIDRVKFSSDNIGCLIESYHRDLLVFIKNHFKNATYWNVEIPTVTIEFKKVSHYHIVMKLYKLVKEFGLSTRLTLENLTDWYGFKFSDMICYYEKGNMTVELFDAEWDCFHRISQLQTLTHFTKVIFEVEWYEEQLVKILKNTHMKCREDYGNVIVLEGYMCDFFALKQEVTHVNNNN